MMMSFREKEGSSSYNRNKDNEQQQEEDESNNNNNNNNNNQSEVGRGRGRASSSSNNNNNSSRQWSSAGLKNPRIVRVSRSFGGKDRHSKVCTIKGLRDRRIRLSVPTAIQLYDLQDRLGLSQPSKVIDWLLDTTKHDIDKLPPLPIIPNSSFSQGFGLPFASSSTPFFFDNASLFPPRKDLDAGAGGSGSGSGAGAGGNININSSSTSTRDHMDANMDEDEEESLVAKLRYWGSTNNAMMRSKHRGVEDHINEDQNQGGNSQVLAQNLFPIASHNTNSANNVLPPHPHPHPTTFLSNNNNPMFNYYHLEPSNLSLTQLGNLGLSSSSSHNDNHQGSSSHHHHSNSATQPPSSLSLSSMSQLFLCPSMATTSFFPQQQHQASFMSSSSHHHPQVENDLRNQFSRFPISNNPFSSNFHNSSGLDSKPFPLSMNHEPQLQQGDEDGNSQGKSGSGHTLWKEP